MDGDDSDNEIFQSAEESPDEDERESGEEIMEDYKFSQKNFDVKKPAETDNRRAFDDTEPVIKNKRHDAIIYRKRPERATNKLKESVAKPVNESKSFRSDSKSKKDIIGSDNLLQDITTNLTKNINKSLNTIQQTSSNVKDLILNSFPAAGAVKKNVFIYDEDDDASFQTKSSLEEGGVCLSNTLPSSEPLNTVSTKLLKTIDKPGSNDNYSKILGNFESIPKDDVTQVLNCDSKNDLNENMYSSNKIKKIDLNKISKSNENSQQSNSNLITALVEAEKDSAIQQDKILPDSESNSKMNEKNLHDFKSKEQERIFKTKNKVIKVADDVVSPDLAQSTFSKNEPSTLLKNSCKSRNQNKIKSSDMRKEEILMPFDFCYATCEQLPQNDDDSESSLSEKNSNKAINVCNDPITDWIIKTSSDEQSDRLKNRSFKGLDKDFKKKIDFKSIEENSIENLDKGLSHNSDGISNHNLPNLASTQENKVKYANDDWEDFDFSDSEISNLEVSSENNEFENHVTKNIEFNLEITEAQSKGEVIKIKNDETRKCYDENEENKTGQNPKDINLNLEKLNAMKENVKNNEWDWEDWNNEDDSGEEKKSNNTDKINESEKTLDKTFWSGWETFGEKEEKKKNWGSWGVNLLLNKASAVTQGISSALESGLGAPDAQTLARMDYIKRKNKQDAQEFEIEKEINSNTTPSDTNLFSSIGITDLVVGVTSKIVEHSKFQEIGSKVITGGLDTLESFGKKTMEVLQDGDPGLRNKRALLLGQSKPTLSQVLREIKDRTEKELKEVEKKEVDKTCHFESIFDDHQGLVHLEALEMLSKQCQLKLEQIRNSCSSEEQDDFDGVLEEVQQLCSLDDFDLTFTLTSDDFEKSLIKAVSPLKNEIFLQKIFEVKTQFDQWLQSFESFEKENSYIMIEQKLVATFAKLTAATIHQYHKAGELLAVKECRKTVEEIDALSEMTHILIKEICHISNSFISLSKELFKGSENLDLITSKIDTVTNNSTTYIRQAFSLLIPILQIGAAV